jgi:hypothetical protein
MNNEEIKLAIAFTLVSGFFLGMFFDSEDGGNTNRLLLPSFRESK